METLPARRVITGIIWSLVGVRVFSCFSWTISEFSLPAQTAAFDLASVGLGLRYKGWRGVSGELNYARALKQSGQLNAGDTRLHFQIGYDW